LLVARYVEGQNSSIALRPGYFSLVMAQKVRPIIKMTEGPLSPTITLPNYFQYAECWGVDSDTQGAVLRSYDYSCKPVEREVLLRLTWGGAASCPAPGPERVPGNFIRDETIWAFLLAKIFWLC
jgi:hypothetical protein